MGVESAGILQGGVAVAAGCSFSSRGGFGGGDNPDVTPISVLLFLVVLVPLPTHFLTHCVYIYSRLPPGRFLALLLARLGREWRAAAAARMPEARGDIREIVGQPVFVPLYNLYLRYGKLFRLRWGLSGILGVMVACTGGGCWWWWW